MYRANCTRFKHYLAALFTLLILQVSGPTWAQPQWTVNVDAQNPPFMYGDQGRAVGLYPYLINIISKQAQINTTLTPISWPRALQALADGSAAIGGIYKNAERMTRYDFSDELFTEKIVVAYNKAQPFQFQSLADLAHHRVGVMSGWSYGDAFDQARKADLFTAYPADSDQQNLKLLSLGRLDAALGVESGIQLNLIKQPAGFDFSKIAIFATPLTINPTFVAVKKNSKLTPILARFNRELQKIKQHGQLKQLIQHYFQHDSGYSGQN